MPLSDTLIDLICYLYLPDQAAITGRRRGRREQQERTRNEPEKLVNKQEKRRERESRRGRARGQTL